MIALIAITTNAILITTNAIYIMTARIATRTAEISATISAISIVTVRGSSWFLNEMQLEVKRRQGSPAAVLLRHPHSARPHSGIPEPAALKRQPSSRFSLPRSERQFALAVPPRWLHASAPGGRVGGRNIR